MAQNLDAMPLMIGDVVRLLPVIISDMMFEPNKTPAEADRVLEDIASRLLEMSGRTTNDRSRLILTAVAQTLMGTDEERLR